MRRYLGIWMTGAVAAVLLGGCEETCENTISPIAEVYIASDLGYVARDIQPVEGDGHIIAGFLAVDSTRRPYEDALLIRTGADGALQWTRSYAVPGADALEEARSVHLAGDGGYVVVGNSGGPVWEPEGLFQLPIQILAFKVDGLGEELWMRTVRAARLTIAYGSCMNADGSFAIAGCSGEQIPGDRGALLIKMNPYGRELWRRTFLAGPALSATDVISTTDGGYAIVGFVEYFSRHPRRWDLYVAKLDEEGNREWDFLGGDRLGIARNWFGESIVQTNDGGYAVTGRTYDVNDRFGATSNLFAAKFDSGGDLVWTSTAPGPLTTAGYALIEDTDDSLVARGMPTPLVLSMAV
ncbi:MAG: hypothetical protein KF886_24365 [Candidatus Hydrogenedentes bacterium]|nr:hypothetical protein [Candidatus Hydrogenedentota bacterium]